jgi:hypothetical protein
MFTVITIELFVIPVAISFCFIFKCYINSIVGSPAHDTKYTAWLPITSVFFVTIYPELRNDCTISGKRCFSSIKTNVIPSEVAPVISLFTYVKPVCVLVDAVKASADDINAIINCFIYKYQIF